MASGTRNKKWLGYTLYVFCVTVVLLYFLFPAQVFEAALDSSIRRLNPEFNFKAEKIRPWIPAGLRVAAGSVYWGNKSVPAMFHADRMYIGPHVLEYLRGNNSIGLEGKAYNGEINGTLHFSGEDKRLSAGVINFSDMALSEYDFLNEYFIHRITGSLSGEIKYDSESQGKATLRLSDGRLQFQVPVLNIASVDLKEIKLEAQINRRVVTIMQAKLEGSEMKGSMTGSIQLQENIGQSQINLKGTLEPLAEFYKNYPEIREVLKTMKKRLKRGQYFFSLTGTLGNPKFKLL